MAYAATSATLTLTRRTDTRVSRGKLSVHAAADNLTAIILFMYKSVVYVEVNCTNELVPV